MEHSDTSLIQYLYNLWYEQEEREQRHQALRDKHTVFLTGNIPDLVTWTGGLIGEKLCASYAFQASGCRLLDIGSRTGTYLSRLQTVYHSAIALDIDLLALEKLSKPGPSVFAVGGSALSLPFPDNTFGAAMQNRMLNLTANIRLALSEARRVLVPDGLLFIVTNDRENLSLLRRLHENAQKAENFPTRFYTRSGVPGQRFTLQNGQDWLAGAGFAGIEFVIYERVLEFKDLETIMEYYASGLLFHSSSGFDEPGTTPESWTRVYRTIEERLKEELAQGRKLQIRDGSALFIARKPG